MILAIIQGFILMILLTDPSKKSGVVEKTPSDPKPKDKSDKKGHVWPDHYF